MMVRRRPLHMTWESALRSGVKQDHPPDMVGRLSYDSNSWLHCAVGEKLGFGDQTPTVNSIVQSVVREHYRSMYDLAVDFTSMIDFENWEGALETYQFITAMLPPEDIHLIRRGVQMDAKDANVPIATMRLPPEIIIAMRPPAPRQAAAGTGRSLWHE